MEKFEYIKIYQSRNFKEYAKFGQEIRNLNVFLPKGQGAFLVITDYGDGEMIGGIWDTVVNGEKTMTLQINAGRSEVIMPITKFLDTYSQDYSLIENNIINSRQHREVSKIISSVNLYRDRFGYERSYHKDAFEMRLADDEIQLLAKLVNDMGKLNELQEIPGKALKKFIGRKQ